MGSIISYFFPKHYLNQQIKRKPSLRNILRYDKDFQNYLKVYSGVNNYTDDEENFDDSKLSINL